jgi:hypothetical protein
MVMAPWLSRIRNILIRDDLARGSEFEPYMGPHSFITLFHTLITQIAMKYLFGNCPVFDIVYHSFYNKASSFLFIVPST